MKTELTCISCPLGCAMTAEYEAGANGVIADTVKVTGSGCARGVLYAKDEVAAPKRTVTTTLKRSGGGTVSVKTAAPVPKAEIFAALAKLKGIEIAPPVRIGQALVKEVSAGIDIVATEEIDT